MLAGGLSAAEVRQENLGVQISSMPVAGEPSLAGSSQPHDSALRPLRSFSLMQVSFWELSGLEFCPVFGVVSRHCERTVRAVGSGPEARAE